MTNNPIEANDQSPWSAMKPNAITRLGYRASPQQDGPCYKTSDATAVLVSVAGTVGEPLYIYSTAGRRGGRAVRVHDQHIWHARAEARGVADGSGEAAGTH